MDDFTKLKNGDKIIAKRDFFTEFSYGKTQRLTAGKTYTVDSYNKLGLYIESCDAGHRSCWGFATDATEYFTIPKPTEVNSSYFSHLKTLVVYRCYDNQEEEPCFLIEDAEAAKLFIDALPQPPTGYENRHGYYFFEPVS